MMRRARDLSAVFAYAVLGAACVNLTEVPVSGVTEKYYDSPVGFDAAINASYEGLRDFYAVQRGFAVTIFGTDEFTRGADGAYKYINDYTPQLNGDDAYMRENWQLMWRAINTTNTAIAHGATANLADAVKNPKIAEARFLRAIYYFILVRLYGDLPILLTETSDPTAAVNREPVAKVYDAIIADLQFAETNLPDVAKEYGRATKPAAQHMLALVYLTRGGPGDMALAATKAKAVIANTQFGLLTNWKDNFVFGNERNKEVVWSVQYTADPLTTGPGNEGHLYFLMAYELFPGMQRDLNYGRAFKRFRPTDWLLNLWDRTKDSRYDDGFQVTWLANNAATIPKDASGKPKYALGDTAIWMPGVEVTAAFRATKPYTVIAPSQYTDAAFPTLNKFLDPARLTINETHGSRDFVVARLAETYLIAAEALIRDGKASEAVTYVNAVRQRAAKPGQAVAMAITTADLSIDFILDERSRELAGEQMRWFDLVRTGKLMERVKKYNAAGAVGIQSFHVLRPIPTQQLQSAKGFTQNSGY
jgi:hypothetical protein